MKQDEEKGGEVLKRYAEEVGARYEVVPMIPEVGLELGLRGKHQWINASLAVCLAKSFLSTKGHVFSKGEILPKSFVEPLKRTRWPGRCQKVVQGKTTWLLDGAHTTESLRSCGEWAWDEGKPDVLVFNCSGGRAGESLLGALSEAGTRTVEKSAVELGNSFDSVIFCTNVTYVDGNFKGGKSHVQPVLVATKLIHPDLTSNALDPNDVSQLATQHALREAWLKLNPSFPSEKVHVVASIEHAVNIVRGLGEKQVLVAGSLHLVGGVMEVAGLQDTLSME